MSKKNEAQKLQEELTWSAPHIAKEAPEQKEKAFKYCEGYKEFLNKGKTERECVKEAVKMLKKAGYKPFDRKASYVPGDKVYVVNREKAVIATTFGKKPLKDGLRINGAHIDAPRLDLKPNPLYEKEDIAYFKTHYYGGIRKYQWGTMPLAIHGVVAKKNGELIEVCIGEKEDEPAFCITDLLPHLAGKQNERPLREGLKGEELNVIIGSIPYEGEEIKEAVKLMVLSLLHEKYGIKEKDFFRAEFELVPAAKARDIGLDRSLVGAYGQDDRVCAYACLQALLELEGAPRLTGVCVLADKEEIGSLGVTGMQSAAFDIFMSDLCDSQGAALKACYENAFCLSADVTAAYDPNFAEAYEVRNSAFLNYGVCLSKYTGARGKSGASDASAEVVGKVRRIFEENQVIWQLAELGKTDQGGGGTVACYMANRNIDTIDAGVPVLSMHAPFETTAKLDCYMTYKAMKALYTH